MVLEEISPDRKTDMNRNRILLVEDEQDIAELVVLHLADLCDEVVVASDGHEGMHLATTMNWALIILDLGLPGPDGLEICRAVRRLRAYQPIMMLTAKGSELDRVLGLETGADDYLPKPFSVLELAARVRAIMRRVKHLRHDDPADAEAANLISVGSLTIDPRPAGGPQGWRAHRSDGPRIRSAGALRAAPGSGLQPRGPA